VAQACCCAITNVLFQCCDVCDVLLLCCGCGAITHRRQVNQEQQLGLPVAPHMGAGDAATWAKMEVQFIDYVAGPLWERLGQVRPAVHGRHMLVVGPGEQPSHQPTGAALLLAAGVDRPRGTIPRSLGGGGSGSVVILPFTRQYVSLASADQRPAATHKKGKQQYKKPPGCRLPLLVYEM
jgi:hypothetical protein